MSAVPQPAPEPAPALIRPYMRTRGRTRPAHAYSLEALVATTAAASGAGLPPEQQEIVDLCRHTLSVAEVSALLGLPLGVVRVLLGDLVGEGIVTVNDPALVLSGDGRPGAELMERVLRGLQKL